ncbi:MAG: uracil-DNA glycosylase [Magnetococcales bacterium]|nr:uracil-DNA glycosylase [Magnetococcales bacterium]
MADRTQSWTASDLLATLRYWRVCGIDRLTGEQFGFAPVVEPKATVPIPIPTPPPPSLERLISEPVPLVARESWIAGLAQEISSCQQCRLSQTRNQTVMGVGALDAPVVWIGDAPQEEEERTGEPFAGEARAIFQGMVRAVGLDRNAVYLTNIIKCRPPGDRTPKPDEILHCQPFLFRQLELIRPKAIFVMGKVAIDCLLGPVKQVGQARGKVHFWRGVAVVASYHPVYCLRTPSSKRMVWEDLLLMQKTLEQDLQGCASI